MNYEESKMAIREASSRRIWNVWPWLGVKLAATHLSINFTVMRITVNPFTKDMFKRKNSVRQRTDSTPSENLIEQPLIGGNLIEVISFQIKYQI